MPSIITNMVNSSAWEAPASSFPLDYVWKALAETTQEECMSLKRIESILVHAGCLGRINIKRENTAIVKVPIFSTPGDDA